MYGFYKMGWGVLLTATFALNGCTSFFMGKQYEFPREGEPSATVRLKYDRGTSLDAITFSEKTCYAGYTPLPYNGDFIESKIAANQELVLMYRNVVGGTQCQIPFAFTPQAGATYLVKSGSWSETKPGLIPVFKYDQQYCGIAVVQKTGDKESVQPIQQLRMRTGFPCLRFLPLEK